MKLPWLKHPTRALVNITSIPHYIKNWPFHSKLEFLFSCCCFLLLIMLYKSRTNSAKTNSRHAAKKHENLVSPVCFGFVHPGRLNNIKIYSIFQNWNMHLYFPCTSIIIAPLCTFLNLYFCFSSISISLPVSLRISLRNCLDYKVDSSKSMSTSY